jgi:uncharacterized protein with HEPN domain
MKNEIPTQRDRVQHVLESISHIQQFSAGHTKASFIGDYKSLSATLYQFAIIAEASSHVEPEVLARYSYPWYKVKSFRNFILHEYHGVKKGVIWDTIQVELPKLQRVMEEILLNEFS